MPTIFKRLLIISLLTSFFTGFARSPVLAALDPLTATTSATATIPTLTVTSDSTAPSIPILIRPGDQTITSNNKPEFAWTNSTDSGSNTITYILYINGVATYLGISNLGNASGTGFTSRIDGSEIKLQVTTPILDGSYNWYVTASDPSGNISQSTTWNFTIDTTSPNLSIIDIDTYHNPIIVEGANFDINGPKDIYFTVQSESNIEIQMTLSYCKADSYYESSCHDDLLASDITHLSVTTNSSGLGYLYKHLVPGIYIIDLLAIDKAGNITTLPSFTITIKQASMEITIPGVTEPIISIPYTPIPEIPGSLNATVSIIESRGIPPSLLVSLLAIALLILLILVWKRRYNLILLNDQGIPLTNTIIYHSIPDTKLSFTQVYMSRHEPISYLLAKRDNGKLYIPRLGRYSTLTVRVASENVSTTYILSLSAKSKLYTITLG